MFFRTSKGSLVNLDYLASVTPVAMKDGFKKEHIRNLYSLDELADFGFKVGLPDVFVPCKTWDEAVKSVVESPDTRIMSRNTCIGYTVVKGGNKKSLISTYYDENNTLQTDNSCMCFLPKEKYDSVFAYALHVGITNGGLNNDHQAFIIRIDEYERLEKMLDIK